MRTKCTLREMRTRAHRWLRNRLEGICVCTHESCSLERRTFYFNFFHQFKMGFFFFNFKAALCKCQLRKQCNVSLKWTCHRIHACSCFRRQNAALRDVMWRRTRPKEIERVAQCSCQARSLLKIKVVAT